MAQVFTRHIEKSPYGYYRAVKVERIKKALRDPSLTISEAFASCGVAYSGSFAKMFRQTVGPTPSQYRGSLAKEPDALHPERTAANAVPAGFASDQHPFSTLEVFPLPIQIFAANGDIVFINQAVLSSRSIPDSDQGIGVYNLIEDPFVNIQFGFRDFIRRSFQGETVLIRDARIPLESFLVRYGKSSIADSPRALYTDILNFPLYGETGMMTHMMSIFLEARGYRGKTEVMKAKEYLDNHWHEAYGMRRMA